MPDALRLRKQLQAFSLLVSVRREPVAPDPEIQQQLRRLGCVQ